MSEHPNATRAREGFERFVRGDLPALLDLFADDAVWHVPGSMALSGAHRGREAIIAFLRGTAERTDGSYRVQLLWTVADDDHLVAVYRAFGGRADGRALDIEQALPAPSSGSKRAQRSPKWLGRVSRLEWPRTTLACRPSCTSG